MQSFFNAVPHNSDLQNLHRALSGGNSTKTIQRLPSGGADFIVNLSAWDSLDALYAFVFSQSHRQIMTARDHWFTHVGRALSCLVCERDTYPTCDEAIDRLSYSGSTVRLKTHLTTVGHIDKGSSRRPTKFKR